MRYLLPLFFLTFTLACQNKSETPLTTSSNVETSDIDRFWQAFDLIRQESDSVKQLHILDSVYLKNGTKGLEKIMTARGYSGPEYIHLINQYPKFFSSIRSNTLKAKGMATALDDGIEKLASIYPELKPAKIYFTIGCMRTNGTTLENAVLIGSELAMTDATVDLSEFEGRTKEWLTGYVQTNPIDNLVLLNVHEYVHTQQKPMPTSLHHLVLYEGIAEFVSTLAMHVPSSSPAIAFGQKTPAVKEKFEREMFHGRTYDWLWSSAPNTFGVRDLGYYIGYAIAQKHYNNAEDKTKAIKELIELDYSQPAYVDALIDATEFFTKSIDELRTEDETMRPLVMEVEGLNDGSQTISALTKQLTFHFSEPLNGLDTGVDYAELGEAGFPEITDAHWSADSTSWTINIALKPATDYQFWLTANFRTTENLPLLPYLVSFKTNAE